MKTEYLTNDVFPGKDSTEAFEYIKGYLAGGRYIPLFGAIDEKLISQVSIALLTMECNKVDPITLIIHTNGGSDGFPLENVINSLNSPVDALVFGRACSMGGIILQMCRKRMLLPQSEIYCHFPTCTYTLQGDFQSFNPEYYEFMYQRQVRAHKRQVDLYAKRMGKTPEEVEKFFRMGDMFHHYIDAQEAIDHGLADEIIPSFKIFAESFKGRKEKREEE